jgi:hypothetical protein
MYKYEIFPTQADADLKTERINQLFSYPNGAQTYRQVYQHPDYPSDLRVTGMVDQKLIKACSKMTTEERALYYDENELYTLAEITEHGWFPHTT